jgi:hypothetical protein
MAIMLWYHLPLPASFSSTHVNALGAWCVQAWEGAMEISCMQVTLCAHQLVGINMYVAWQMMRLCRTCMALEAPPRASVATDVTSCPPHTL